MDVTFPGGKRVDAHYNGITVKTDQSPKNGGEGNGPEPFDLFFVSIATCVGIYALEFCNSRDLDTEGLGVRLEAERDDEKRMYTKVKLSITVPEDFPAKYEKAIKRTGNLCTVKKHILQPPEFEVQVQR